MLYYIHQTPLSSLRAEGESGYKTKLSQEFQENTGSSPSDQNFGLSWKKVLPALEANVISS